MMAKSTALMQIAALMVFMMLSLRRVFVGETNLRWAFAVLAIAFAVSVVWKVRQFRKFHTVR